MIYAHEKTFENYFQKFFPATFHPQCTLYSVHVHCTVYIVPIVQRALYNTGQSDFIYLTSAVSVKQKKQLSLAGASPTSTTVERTHAHAHAYARARYPLEFPGCQMLRPAVAKQPNPTYVDQGPPKLHTGAIVFSPYPGNTRSSSPCPYNPLAPIWVPAYSEFYK